MKKFILISSILFIGLTNNLIGQYITAQDNAGNYSSWLNASNEGFGFGAWDLWTVTGGGHFIGNSSGDGFGDINTNEKSFGMWGNPTGYEAHAQRLFNNWGDGASFTIQIATAYRNGYKGIDLWATGFDKIWTFNVGSDKYTTGGIDQTSWAYSQTSIFTLTATQNGANVDISLTRGSDSYSTTISNKTLYGFKMYVGGTFSGALNNLYFNNLKIEYSDPSKVPSLANVTINGAVELAADKTLTVNDLTIAGANTFTLKSNASNTASLITNGTVSGSVTVERYMNNADWTNAQDGWHLISSPVASQAISESFISDPYDFYCWYEPTAQWVNFKNTSTEPTWITANGSTNFTVGRGYMAAYDAGGTKNFTGTLNVADVTFTNLSFNAGTFDGLHLLGNPFSSAVTWYTGWSTSAVGGVAKIWNEAGLSYSSINSGDIIPATQGFFIEVSSGTNAITIPAANRTHSTQAFYKATTYPVIKLTASNLDFPSFQESQIRFNPASTEAFDFEFDGQFFAGYAPLFYSVSDGKNLDVNSLPSLELSLNIPFAFIKNEGDNFSINAELENVSETVFLLDKKTSIDHNLTTNPVYTFTSSENDDPNRFEIHFGLVGINEPDNENPLNAYVYGDRIYVMNSSGSTVLQLFDLQGRMLQSNVLNGNGLQSQSVNLPSGVYVARVNDEKSVKSIKLVIE